MPAKNLILFLLIFSSVIYCQTRISGKITDQNNQPLPGANIYLQNTYDGVSSETDGTFLFSTEEEGEAVLVVSYVSYKTFNLTINLDGEPKYFEITLEEESSELDAVIISAGSFEASDEHKAVILRPLDIVTTGADADIYSTLETLPGTQRIGETDGLFVRGGSGSETKTVVDEMVVQNPFYSSVPSFDDEKNDINSDKAKQEDFFQTGKFTITKSLFSNSSVKFGGELGSRIRWFTCSTMGKHLSCF